jgi:hypothetical protein
MKMKLLTAIAVLAVALGATSMALADTITIGLGAVPVAVASNGGAVPLSYANPAYGGFSVSVTATGSPWLFEPNMDTNTIDVSSGTAGTLWIWVTEQGITSPTGVNNFVSGFTSNLLPAGWTVTEATYVDAANGLFTTISPLASASFNAIGSTSSTNSTPSLSNPFSETEVFEITSVACNGTNCNTSDTIDIHAVTPEPATLSLVGMGLLGLLGLRKKRVA